MNKKIILDASALLALINQEPGADMVEKHLPYSMMSTVNISEVATVLHNIGIPADEIKMIINSLIDQVVPFDNQQAHVAASLREATKMHGLSLGDRACLGLGSIENATVLTADKVWKKLNLPIKIELIR